MTTLPPTPDRTAPRRILGIDPGLRLCGWGVIEMDGSRQRQVACGTVRPDGASLGARLAALHDGLAAVIVRHAPNEAAVENVFVNANAAGTLKLGQARGVALLVPALAGIEVGEYQPNSIKKAVTGVGHATKEQIGHMIALQLPGAAPDTEDAADALAVALCHAFHLQTAGRIAEGRARSGARLGAGRRRAAR